MKNNMRKTINISLPDEMKKEIDREVKKGHFSSRSEFFRHLMREWKQSTMKEVSTEEQKDMEKRYGKSPSRKKKISYSVDL